MSNITTQVKMADRSGDPYPFVYDRTEMVRTVYYQGRRWVIYRIRKHVHVLGHKDMTCDDQLSVYTYPGTGYYRSASHYFNNRYHFPLSDRVRAAADLYPANLTEAEIPF